MIKELDSVAFLIGHNNLPFWMGIDPDWGFELPITGPIFTKDQDGSIRDGFRVSVL